MTDYLRAVLGAFGIDVDYAQRVKHCGPRPDLAGPERKYSRANAAVFPSACPGHPHKALDSTSCVEKHNRTLRQHMKRFARLTAVHSKKMENYVHMVALYNCWYSFARYNSSVRRSPAMASRVTDRLWDIGDIAKLIEDWETQA